LPSTILAARLQHVSSDSVVTNRFKQVSVAIHVSIGPSAILCFSAKMHVTRLLAGTKFAVLDLFFIYTLEFMMTVYLLPCRHHH
jgi:hypothetical protein